MSSAETNSQLQIIFDQLMDSNPLFLTGSTDTVYCSVMLDLEADGATVVEIPPGSGPGTVNDAFFRFVVDMDGPVPDKARAASTPSCPPATTTKGWFAILRLYGPLEPWFEKTWRPGEIELVH